MKERFVSYARNLEDVMLWRAVGRTLDAPGSYIDLGAGDPADPSVTYAFYHRGWRGLDVEPVPERAANLQAARPRDVVVHGVAAVAAIATMQTPVLTLAALCHAHVQGPVHFLRIGGAQAVGPALEGADWAACRPWIVLAEVASGPAQDVGTPVWEPGLLAAGYRFVWFDGLSRFYLAEEHAALAGHFRVQPNLFDSYVAETPAWRQHLETVERLAFDRTQVIERLEAQLRAHAGAAEGPMPTAAAGRRSLVRRLAMAVYRLVRPVARPLGHRGRQFLIGPVLDQLTDLRARQHELVLRQDTASRDIEALLAHARRPPMIDPALGSTMERLLVTLALQEPREAADHAPPAALPTDRAGG